MSKWLIISPSQMVVRGYSLKWLLVDVYSEISIIFSDQPHLGMLLTNQITGFLEVQYLQKVWEMKLISYFSLKWNINPWNTSPTKWSNTLKQFVSKLPTSCLSVFDSFVGCTLKGLHSWNPAPTHLPFLKEGGLGPSKNWITWGWGRGVQNFLLERGG